MDVRELLEQVRSGGVNTGEAEKQFKNLPCEDLGYTKLNHYRKLRSGFGETAFCWGEPDAYLLEIYEKFCERDGKVLRTRASEKQAELVRTTVPEVAYNPISRILKVEKPKKERKGCVAVYTGGTTGIPVVKEVAQTAEYFGCRIDRILDVGVVGIHRLLAQKERLDKASCIVTAAGMEGALGTVIAGLVECPVVAVSASVGYGADFHGLLALLTILNSYISGIPVVNIDNRYGAGYLTTQINKMAVG